MNPLSPVACPAPELVSPDGEPVPAPGMAAVAPALPDAKPVGPTCHSQGADLALSSTTSFSVTRVASSSVCWPAFSRAAAAVRPP